MNIILSIGLRNLLRQKRRNILLGSGIAFGMMILVLAAAFSQGITDVLFNKVIVYMTGHMQVAVSEFDKKPVQIIRDKARMEELIRKNVSGIKDIWEDIIGFARVQGNGKSEFSIVVGLKPEPASFEGVILLEGSLADFSNGRYAVPMIIYEKSAHNLKLKLHDTIRMRMETISGQVQTASGTVVGITKANSMFEAMTMFMPLETLKTTLGFKPWETGGLKIMLENPLESIAQADRLHAAMTAGLAVADGTLAGGGSIRILGIQTNAQSREALARACGISQAVVTNKGDLPPAFVNRKAAADFGLAPGRTIEFTHRMKYNTSPVVHRATVAGVFEGLADEHVLLLREHEFNPMILKHVPAAGKTAFTPDKSPLAGHLSREWRLLPRSGTSEELQAKMKQVNNMRYKGGVIDVRTMYESASIILKLEGALNMITFVAVLILFFIILVGVVNTLRMTIRERTREIGTMRAMGMQQKDVRNVFLLETLFLGLFASIAGVIIGLILMVILGSISMDGNSALGMLLVNGKLYFLPTFGSILGNMVFITLLTLSTAWFPARRAARLDAARALRHYE